MSGKPHIFAKFRTKVAWVLFGLALAAGIVTNVIARRVAHNLVTNPITARPALSHTPADYNMPFSEVVLTNRDGMKLFGWFVPSQNHATVIAQHGYRQDRAEMLPAAAMLYRHGYGVLITSVRAHDRSDGEQITFGYREQADMDAWFEYLLTRNDVDPKQIGALGNSMGGLLVIQLASRNPRIRAVATDCAFSSLKETLSVSVPHFARLPAFPFAPLCFFWAKVETRCDLSAIDAKIWIARFQSQPVLLMQGGADATISPRSGQLLFDAAHEPKELWFEPGIRHARFALDLPAPFGQRVVSFFDRYLLTGQNPAARP